MSVSHVLVIVLSVAITSASLGQSTDSTFTRQNHAREFVAPIILVSASMITLTDNEVFDRWEINEARQAHFPHFKTSADDYLQYAPAVAAYAMDAFHIQARHRIWPKTWMLLKSEVIMIAIAVPMKYIVAFPRPDTGAKDAFPSGHTAQAFAAATFFHKEYGHLSVWYSIGAYTVASSVGVIRVLNDRHWISDVLAGAGIGILATNLAYLTDSKKAHARHTHLSSINMIPSYSRGAFGLSMSARIN